MSWRERPLAAFDTETTGPDPETARIVTACVGAVNDGPPTAPRVWLVNPGIDIPAEATAIHGITTEHAREHGGDPAVTCAEIRDALRFVWGLGNPVIVYNAPFDLTVLDRELTRHGHGGLGEVGPVIDPLVLDRSLDRYRKGRRTLTAACQYYGVRLEAAHDAAAAALAAARVAWRIAQRYPAVAEMTLDELMTFQTAAHVEWAVHFTEYLRGKGKPDVIDPSWPIRRAAVTA